MWSGAIITPMLPCQTLISSGRNMHLNSRLRWVDNVETKKQGILSAAHALLCDTFTFAAHTHKQQTSRKTQNIKMKTDATLSNMTPAFPQLLGHTGTLTTFVIITGVSPHSGLRVIRPGPPSQTILCLLTSPVLRNTGTRSLKSSGLWISNVWARLSLLTLITRGRPSLSPPSVSSHVLTLLLSQAPAGPRITHQTRSPGSVTLSHSAASRPEDFTQKRK